MRILGVTKSTGGLATYNRMLCTQLSARGHDVSAVCLSEGNETYASELRAQKIQATPIAMERYSIAVVSDLRVAWKLLEHIRREAIDVVVAHGAKAGFLMRLVGRLVGTPVVYVPHSLPFLERVQGSRAVYYRQLERFASHLGGPIVVVAHSMREELLKSRIGDPSRVTVVHTGIELDRFGCRIERDEACRQLGLDPSRPVVGWAARLSPQKAPLDYIRAAERIVQVAPNAQIVMAGEGPLINDVQRLSTRIGLDAFLTMVPWQADVRQMLSALDVYVMTSHWEGLPLSLLEAMASRCAVVVTKVDGVAEVVRDGVDGYLVEPGNHRMCADRVSRLISDDSLRFRLGHNARRRIEAHFTIERMTNEWERLLEDVVSD